MISGSADPNAIKAELLFNTHTQTHTHTHTHTHIHTHTQTYTYTYIRTKSDPKTILNKSQTNPQ